MPRGVDERVIGVITRCSSCDHRSRSPVRTARPLLMFAERAATDRGAEPRPLTWLDSELAAAERDGTDPAEMGRRVGRCAAPSAIGPGHVPVVICKSLGSYAARIAVDQAAPAGWLTPLLHDATVVNALRAPTAPFLLIGGTADRGGMVDARGP